MWMGSCRGLPTGLGVATEGREQKLEDLGDWDPKDIKTYPMVWVNPVTGEKAFQVHGIVARKLFIRSSPDETPKVIDDVAEIRKFLKVSTKLCSDGAGQVERERLARNLARFWPGGRVDGEGDGSQRSGQKLLGAGEKYFGSRAIT